MTAKVHLRKPAKSLRFPPTNCINISAQRVAILWPSLVHTTSSRCPPKPECHCAHMETKNPWGLGLLKRVFKVWLDLNSSFHRTKVGLKPHPYTPTPYQNLGLHTLKVHDICRVPMWTAAALKAESWHAPWSASPTSLTNPKNVTSRRHVSSVFGHFSHLGIKPYFLVNSSRKNYILLTTNTPPTWPPCQVVSWLFRKSQFTIHTIPVLKAKHIPHRN